MTITRGSDRADFTTYTTPRRSLGRTALVSGASSLPPVFAVLFWLTVETMALPAVVSAEAVLTGLFFVVFLRYKLVFAGVTPTTLVKRRMLLPAVSVDRARVDHVTMNRIYRGSSPETLTHMLVLDSDGNRLFGMSSLFWSSDDIRRVADSLDVQIVVDDLPVSRQDYYAMFPMARGWYSTRLFRLLVVAVGAGAVAAGLTIARHLIDG